MHVNWSATAESLVSSFIPATNKISLSPRACLWRIFSPGIQYPSVERGAEARMYVIKYVTPKEREELCHKDCVDFFLYSDFFSPFTNGLVSSSEHPNPNSPECEYRPRGTQYGHKNVVLLMRGWVMFSCCVPLLGTAYLVKSKRATNAFHSVPLNHTATFVRVIDIPH